MPALELFVNATRFATLPDDGNLVLDPPLPDLSRVLLRRLVCSFRVPPVAGIHNAVIDTGAPLTILPHWFWHDWAKWQVGRDDDELPVAGVGSTLRGEVLGHRYSFTLARLKVKVILSGREIVRDPRSRLELDSLVCQLADASGPNFILLGLWGGAFTGRRLAVELLPNSDDIAARLEF